MRNLQGKSILVCGGATGIGAATVRRLCDEGARVGIGDLNIETAEALARELRDAGGEAAAWHYDQAEEATINELVAGAVEHFDGLDGLFANVADIGAVMVDGDILSNDSALWERTLRVNLVGLKHFTRLMVPKLNDGGPCFLLESAERSDQIGRFSFIGASPRWLMRCANPCAIVRRRHSSGNPTETESGARETAGA